MCKSRIFHKWGEWQHARKMYKTLRPGGFFMKEVELRDCQRCGERQVREVRDANVSRGRVFSPERDRQDVRGLELFNSTKRNR